MDDDGEPFVLSSGVATAMRPPAYKKLAAHRYNANFTDHHLHFLYAKIEILPRKMNLCVDRFIRFLSAPLPKRRCVSYLVIIETEFRIFFKIPSCFFSHITSGSPSFFKEGSSFFIKEKASDLASVRTLKQFTDPTRQNSQEFIDVYNDTVDETALTTCNKHQKAFMKEFFSKDIQADINAQFFNSKAPLKRVALLTYFNEWYDRLRAIKVPKRSKKDIIIEFVRKAPESLEQDVTSRRYNTYKEFRRVIQDLTFGKEQIKSNYNSKFHTKGNTIEYNNDYRNNQARYKNYEHVNKNKDIRVNNISQERAQSFHKTNNKWKKNTRNSDGKLVTQTPEQINEQYGPQTSNQSEKSQPKRNRQNDRIPEN
ncbi:hypothetical protein PGB90_006577 [Kerria lacca]